MQSLIFLVGDSAFAVPVTEIEVVLPVPILEPLVGAPAHIAGLLKFQGRLLPVVDLAILRGLEPAKRHISCRLILVRSESEREAPLALMVDKVLEVFELTPAGTLSPAVTGEGGGWLQSEVLAAGDLLVRAVHWKALLPEDLRHGLRARAE
jgi:chemotaxis signal transduction protein